MVSRFYVVFCLILLGLPQKGFATHIVGSDIFYKCTGTPGIFEVTFIFYRACEGIPICTAGCGSACTISLDILGADPNCSSFFFGSISLGLVGVRDVNINLDCPTSKNTCTNMGCMAAGFYTPGVERYEFKGYANIGPTSGIPTSCCNVRFAILMSARNSSISTGGADQDFYIDATVNRCLSTNPCNSSPVLTNDPFAIICGGENYVFNNGASDPDLDSLSYSFTPALKSFGSSVPYYPPFAFDKPMPYAGNANGVFPNGIHCDPLSGDIMFTPPNAGQLFIGIMAIEIKQWKLINGVMTVIGITRRDVQMVVRGDCLPNNPPWIITDPPENGNMNVPKTGWSTCAGDQLCFTITAKDTDFNPPTISDTTYLSWNAALAGYGATFKPDYNPAKRSLPDTAGGGPREDRYLFCWTPDESLASTTPYYFTISAKDKRCPNPGRITRAFSILVLGKANLKINKANIGCGKWRFSYTNLNAKFPPSSTLWQISRVPGDEAFSQNPYIFTNTANPGSIQFYEGGRYYILIKAVTPGPIGSSGCVKFIKDSFDVDTVMIVQKQDTFACKGNSILLTVTPKFGKAPFNYKWYNSIKDTAIPELNSSIASANFAVTPGSTGYYTVIIKDLNQCKAIDSVKVEVKPLPVGLLPTSERICYQDTLVLDPGNNYGNIRSYLWNVGDTTRTIIKTDSGQYIVTLKDTLNCIQKDTIMLYVNRKVIADAGPDKSICEGESVTLKGTGGQYYKWRNLNNSPFISVNTDTFRVTPANTSVPTRYELKVTLGYPDSTFKQCSNTDTITVKVNARPKLQSVGPIQGCISDATIYLPSRFLDPAQSPGQGAGSGIWNYSADPGAIITGSLPQIQVNKLKNVPYKDTLGWFDNPVVYVFTGPVNLGGCVTKDTAIVRIYGSPPTDAGKDLTRCDIGGIYELTKTHSYSPQDAPLHNKEIWIGAGVDSTFAGGIKYYTFNPRSPSVQVLPAKNVLTYLYTHQYNQAISCSKSDEVNISVTRAPKLNVSDDILVCQNEPVFLITDKTNAIVDPVTGTSPYWESSTSSINGTAITADGKSFNASFINVPNGASQNKYLLYYTDTSSGCKVRDSIFLTIARVPKVELLYNQPVPDSPFVCQNTRDIYFKLYASPPTSNNLTFEPSGAGVQYEGSAAFGYNPDITGTRHVFHSNLAEPGIYMLKTKYTDKTVENINGCIGVDSTVINVQEPPSIAVTNPGGICSNDTMARVSLSPNPGNSYLFKWVIDPSADGYFTNDSINPTNYIPGTKDKNAGQVIIKAVTLKQTTMRGNGDQCAPAEASNLLDIYAAPKALIIPIDSEGCVPYVGKFIADETHGANNTYTWLWDGIEDTNKDSVLTRRVESYETGRNGKYNLALKVVSGYGDKECANTSIQKVLVTHAVPIASFTKNPESTTIARPFFDFINQSYSVDQAKLNYLWNLGPGPDPLKQEDRLVTMINPTQIEYTADTACQKVILQTISDMDV